MCLTKMGYRRRTAVLLKSRDVGYGLERIAAQKKCVKNICSLLDTGRFIHLPYVGLPDAAL